MASNKRILKAYIRYDGEGRIIPGSLILSRVKPRVGNWQEIDAYECCNPTTSTSSSTTTQILGLRLLFDNIATADLLVGDASSLGDWNTFFDLPTYGIEFSSIVINGSEVKLIGSSSLTIKDSLFSSTDGLLGVFDDAGYITTIQQSAFYDCVDLVEVSFPECTTTEFGGTGVFEYSGLEIAYMPKLSTMAESTFNYCRYLYDLTIDNDNITEIFDSTFDHCYLLTDFSFPNATAVGGYAFSRCDAAASFDLSSVTALGPTVLNNSVFYNTTGNIITLTVPTALMTCNTGNPDGDIQYLQANNTVTIITT